MTEISPSERQQIADYRRLQQDYMALQENRTRARIELEQIKRALSYLGDASEESDVFKRVGSLMVKTNPVKLKEELSERKGILEKYIMRVDQQIRTIEKRMKKIEDDLKMRQ